MPECCASFSTTSHDKDAESFDCRLLEPQSGKKRMVEGTLPAKNFRLPTPPTVELKVSVRVISVIDQCGLTQQDQTSRRSHFKYHAITQFRHFWSF